MCWGRTQDQALLSQLPKTGYLICPEDSPGLQGMEDQSPDPGPAPPAKGLQDAPQRDRCLEEDCGPQRVPQMKIEDRSLKFDFHVIPSKCFSIKVIVRTSRSGLTGPIFVTLQIVVSCTRPPRFVLLFAHVSFPACIYNVSRNLCPASRTLCMQLLSSIPVQPALLVCPGFPGP